MLIYDTDRREEPALDRLLADWWATIRAWLRRPPAREPDIEDESERKQGRPCSLIL